ncbi:hypothetical protein SAMN05216431_10411 [Ligilactobacillus sp. WC1T17]|uniref:Nucleotidyltransferase family protein n=1 Tax=Ligilactobacillus ruminis TaxID=1623 RepID=A0ABY1AAI3_9LACO|nr:hypothetical protein SAMN05216431_10411 [Ligilactobacillus ruminis]
MHEEQLIEWINQDPHFSEIFNILARYHLPEVTLCAGTIRELVWNHLENKPSSIMRNNLDIYYNDPGQSYEEYLTIQSSLNQRHSKYLWDLRNITLKKRHSDKSPDGATMNEVIANFPEKCSAIGVAREIDGSLNIIAPYGLDELFSETITSTGALNDLDFKRRIERKKWLHDFEKATLNI